MGHACVPVSLQLQSCYAILTASIGIGRLRDYSQAMDVAGLSKLSRQAIINLVMVLGFLAHGYATGEFEVTEERLGVYLPTEHIDNPKDYNDNKDARQVHPKLRPPIDPQELEIDPQSGMLNYIANERGHWDTSKAVARRTLLQCIDMGRRGKSSGGHEALYEAYRLLGTGEWRELPIDCAAYAC